jgi:hypothetical protein
MRTDGNPLPPKNVKYPRSKPWSIAKSIHGSGPEKMVRNIYIFIYLCVCECNHIYISSSSIHQRDGIGNVRLNPTPSRLPMEMEILRLQVLQAAPGAAGDSWRTGTPGYRCSNPLFTTSESCSSLSCSCFAKISGNLSGWVTIFQQDRSTWASF